LLDVQHRLNLHHKSAPAAAVAAPPPHHEAPHHAHLGRDPLLESKKSVARRLLASRAKLIPSGMKFVKDESWAGPLRWVFAQAIFLAVVVLLRGCWKSRRRESKRL
jgi:hypothetical protein